MKYHILISLLVCVMFLVPSTPASPPPTNYDDFYEIMEESFRIAPPTTLSEDVREEYHTYPSMTALMHDIAYSNPDIVHIESIGKTYEGRELWAMRITGPGEWENRPGVLFIGAHHAREWISFEVPIAIMETLVSGYGRDTRITWLVNNRNIWIVPMLNPDGVSYMQETGNGWRKNRQPWRGEHIVGENVLPIGVDLNRNYGYKWGYPNAATTQNPYSDTYRGPEPFSERETRAIRDLAMRISFATCITYHSYSELILYPWGYTPDVGALPAPPPDEDIYLLVGGKMAEMTGYTVSQANELYPASGDTTDYLYATHGTISFTFELAKEFIPPIEELEEHTLPNIDAALYLIEVSDNPRQDGPIIGHQQTLFSIAQGDTYPVEAEISSQHGVREARVYYSIDGGPYNHVVMENVGGEKYVGRITPYDDGEVRYYVWAQDILGHHSTNATYSPLEAYVFNVEPDVASGSIPLLLAGAAILLVAVAGMNKVRTSRKLDKSE
ncbi:MAG: M14 family metallopeptidase [Candidatus Thermoplasmatota archaeon]|nr:M14 family metallopeptidase [Candidatus Thermoplasmatota archaeon]